nr:unnamed protein product [Digitaria exilis]
MASPASVISDVAEPQAEDPPRAEAAATVEPEGSEAEAPPAAEPAGASIPSAVSAPAAAPGDASSAPAPAPTCDSVEAPPPASPATTAAPGPPRPQFAGSPAYLAPPAPSPSFSYNVLPRAPAALQIGGGAASLKPGSSPALTAAPMPVTALQPPAPGQFFGNAPSFSYNVVSHANARLPTGQQFQPDTGTNHAGQASRFVPPGSLQPTAPGQSTRPGSTFSGAMAPNPPGSIQLPFSTPRPSNIPFGASAQQVNLDINISKSDGPSGPEVSPHNIQLPIGLPSNSPSTIASASGSSSIPIQMPTNLSLPPRPEDMVLSHLNLYGDTPILRDLLGFSSLPSRHGGQVNEQLEEKRNTRVQDSDAWSAHKTETGVVYYYNALTGESTYQRPPGYKGEAEKVAAQPVPVSWDKLAGTDWSIVTTSDGKKYYYDNKQKVSSWQLPPELAEILKNVESGSLKEGLTSLQDGATIENKGVISTDASTPAIQTGGRDSLPLRQTVAPASPSALDLIKKKLQDAGSSSAPSPLATSSSAASELNGSKPADAALKGQQVSNNGEKSKDNNGDANMSDSSSDSDDEEHGPSKEDCIRQFKEMLKERGVAPFSKWEKELPKIVFDPRFKAIPSHSTRRAIFDHYVRTRADEERKEKRAAQKAAVEAYKELLEESSEDINEKTDYQEFKRKWGADPRFEALDRKEREALFSEKVKAIQDKVQSMRKAVIADFKSMLREIHFVSDPQGRALNPDLGQGDAEKLFRDHVKDLYEILNGIGGGH